MHWQARYLLVVLGMVGTTNVASAPRFAAWKADAQFCGELLQRLNAGDSPETALAQIKVKSPFFSPGKITFQASPSTPQVAEDIEYAQFDIDNDGRDETVIKYLTSHSGRYGDLAWIIRPGSRELDFEKAPSFPGPSILRWRRWNR